MLMFSEGGSGGNRADGFLGSFASLENRVHIVFFLFIMAYLFLLQCISERNEKGCGGFIRTFSVSESSLLVRGFVTARRCVSGTRTSKLNVHL